MRKECKEELLNAVFGFMEGSIKISADLCKSRLKAFHNVDCEVIIESYNNDLVIVDYKMTPVGSTWGGGFKGTVTVDGETYSCTRDFKDAYEHNKLLEGFYDDDWFYESDKDYHTLQHKELKSNL